jgi:hypothetical protein
MNLITPIKNQNTEDQSGSEARKREIAYCMDLLIPGLYIWIGSFTIRLFGEQPDDQPYKYPGQLNNNYGIALILPGYHIFTTYKDSYDPR